LDTATLGMVILETATVTKGYCGKRSLWERSFWETAILEKAILEHGHFETRPFCENGHSGKGRFGNDPSGTLPDESLGSMKNAFPCQLHCAVFPCQLHYDCAALEFWKPH